MIGQFLFDISGVDDCMATVFSDLVASLCPEHDAVRAQATGAGFKGRCPVAAHEAEHSLR